MEQGLIPNTTSRIQLFWSDILSSASAKIWYFISFCNYFGISSSFQLLQFGICVQFLQICFVFWSNRIISRRYLYSFCNLCLVSAIWYFVLRCFCIMVIYDCWLWLLKEMFASVRECEVGWEELFVLELCNEKFP